MWKLLVKNQRGNKQSNLFRHIQTNKILRNESEEESALNSKFTKPIRNFLHKMTLVFELKSKEADNLFSSATNQIEESLKSSNRFWNKEIDHAKKSVLQLAKIPEVQLEVHKNCLGKYNEEIQHIKKKFSEKIKICTEKTVIILETVRSKYENDLQEAKDLKKLSTRALKECLNKKGNIQNCIDIETKTAYDKYKNVLEKLQKSSSASNESVAELIKSANDCYRNAQNEVMKTIPEIVEKTLNCIKYSKENQPKPSAAVEKTIFYNEDKPNKVLQKTIAISTEIPKSENNTNAQEEKLECLYEARKDVMNTINLVLHEIESSEKLTEIIKRSTKKDPHLQEIIRYTDELVQDVKQVIKNCTKNDWNKEVEVDILKCLADIFDSIKLKKFELMKRVDALKKEKKQSTLEIDKALEWISSAEEKLQKLEKIFKECIKSGKK